MSYIAGKIKMGWNFKSKLTLKVKVDRLQNIRDSPIYFAPLIQIWWSYLEGVMSYGTDAHTHTQADAGNDNTRRPTLPSDKNRLQYSIIYHLNLKILE